MIVKITMSHAEKLRKYGDGEWIDEPDEVFFDHSGIACEIFRHSKGYLIGMCALPREHPWTRLAIKETEVDIHGHVFVYKTTSNEYIGFSCDMVGDLIPCWKSTKLADQLIDAMEKKEDDKYRDFIYRNLEFTMEQCRYLAEQVIEAHEPSCRTKITFE